MRSKKGREGKGGVKFSCNSREGNGSVKFSCKRIMRDDMQVKFLFTFSLFLRSWGCSW